MSTTPRVIHRPLAATDVLDIWDHIAEDNLDQADRWIDKLDEKFRRLARKPLIGRARKELATDLRSFPFGRYVISSTPVHDGIDVVRVLTVPATWDAAFVEEP